MKKLFLAFIAMGAMLFSMEASAQSSNTVYVCTGKYSVKYHKTNTCSGLSACTSDIVSTTVAAAKKNGKEECLKCYANAKAAPAKEVKKESRKEVKETAEKKTTKKVATKKEPAEKKVAEKKTTTKKAAEKKTTTKKAAKDADE